MAAPFQVEGATPGSQVWSVDASGNTMQSGNMAVTGTANLPNGLSNTVTGTETITGIIYGQGGYNSSTGVNVLVGTQVGAGGTATIANGTGGTQLSDITRDYMVYMQCTTTGGATIVLGSAQGNAVGIATVFVGSALLAGTSGVISFRVPAGWYTRFTGTTAVFNNLAISC